MNADDFELYIISSITSGSDASQILKSVHDVGARISSELPLCDASSANSIRSHLSPWWRTLGTACETALALTSLSHSRDVSRKIHQVFHSLNSGLEELVSSAGFDSDSKDTATIYTGFLLAYTSVVRAALESVHAVVDPVMACDLLLSLEAILPLDNKGNSNLYKKARQAESDSLKTILASATSPEFAVDAFPESDVAMEDGSRAFERFWTMMDVSRRNQPELLTETKSWGRFSQSAGATLSLLLDQPDGFESSSAIAREPVEYEVKPASFAIQLSSSSFRRRALLNILFTCSYVSQNSTNALVTTGAKTLFSTVLKSVSPELGGALSLLFKMENQWVAWKSFNHSKEVCGPFEKRSRIERGLVPFGESVVDLTSVGNPFPTDLEVEPNPALAVIAVAAPEGNPLASAQGNSHAEILGAKKADYRQYVVDAILCDISDEAQVARYSSSDAGYEEAMRNNKDRVLLWQFKRMRFATDLAGMTQTIAEPEPESMMEESQPDSEPVDQPDRAE